MPNWCEAQNEKLGCWNGLENLDFSSLHWFQLQVKNSDLLPLGSPNDAFHRCPKGFPKAQEVQC